MTDTILVTGVSSGIGYFLVDHLSKAGKKVVGSVRQLESFTPPAHWNDVQLVSLDMSDPTQFAAQLEAALKKSGPISTLINNAGYGVFGPAEALTMSDLTQQLQVNFLSVACLCQKVIPQMRQAGQGQIINVSSLFGRVSGAYGSAYHASKFALEGYTESLYFELKPLGIQVKLIEPGYVETDFYKKSSRDHLDNLPQQYTQNLRSPEQVYQGHVGGLISADQAAQEIIQAMNTPDGPLRFPIGQHAKETLKLKANMDDNAFVSHWAKNFWIQKPT